MIFSKPHLRKFVLVFFEDILIYSRSLEEHLQQLVVVLEILATHQLVENFKKCQFPMCRIEYLGHISLEGVAADPSKIEAMIKWPAPKNVNKLRGFLGLIEFY